MTATVRSVPSEKELMLEPNSVSKEKRNHRTNERSLHKIIECDKKLSFSSFHTMMCAAYSLSCERVTMKNEEENIKSKIISDDCDDDHHDDEENNRRSNKTKMNILLCVHTFKPNRRESKQHTHSRVSQNEKKMRKRNETRSEAKKMNGLR